MPVCLCVKGFVATLLWELRLIRKCENHYNRHLFKPSAKRLKIIFNNFFSWLWLSFHQIVSKRVLYGHGRLKCVLQPCIKRQTTGFLKIQQFKPMEWILMYRLQINTNLFAGSSLATLSLLYEWCRITQTFTGHIICGGKKIPYPSCSALKSGKSWNVPQARKKQEKMT